MPHVITTNCVKCGSCAETCPVEAIATNDSCDFYNINPDECIDCGACTQVCGTDAIYPEDELPEEFKECAAKNAEFYK